MIKLYYQAAENNFGDVLSAKIVEKAFGKNVEWASLKEADLVALGSLGERVIKKRFRRYILKGFKPLKVWGTGYLEPGQAKSDCFLEVHALRGKFSALRLRTKRDVALGDPGFLSSLFWPMERSFNKCGILCIGHANDVNSAIWVSAVKRVFHDQVVTQVSITSDWADILSIISKSALVISTAMHPLIVAASYNVPFVWIATGAAIHSGADYKFRDSFSVFPMEPLSIDLNDLVMGRVSRSELNAAGEQSVIGVKCISLVQKDLLAAVPL